MEEAYGLLLGTPKAKILGGGLFIRLQKHTMPLLIDLSLMDLNYIKELKDGFVIGPMTTLRSLEKSTLPKAITDSVKQISGVGTRNIATIGGSVCGRYPFSDINTALMSLDAYLIFYNAGKMSMRDYYELGLKDKDILLEIVVKKPTFSTMKFYKKVYTDFSLVNVSVSDNDIAIGGRPMKSFVLTNCDFNKSAKDLLKGVEYKSDFQSSKEYRRALAETLLDDILKERQVSYGS